MKKELVSSMLSGFLDGGMVAIRIVRILGEWRRGGVL
jgi:hypothetical protein